MPDMEEQKAEKKKSEKKTLRVSISEDCEETDATIELMVSEFQCIINRIAKIEEEKHREARIAKLEMVLSEVESFAFCGVHRLGKRSRGRPRPLIARFMCRSDRDKVWKLRQNLKGSQVNIREDLPKRVQDLTKNVLVPVMKKAKEIQETKHT